ncbi:hypothetical protein BH20CHL7_BH20CHL7_07110 [soil metagenome]
MRGPMSLDEDSDARGPGGPRGSKALIAVVAITIAGVAFALVVWLWLYASVPLPSVTG